MRHCPNDAERSANDPFIQFYSEEYPAVARLAYMLCGSKLISEDMTQDAFLAVEPRFGVIANPAGYVRTVLVRRIISWERRELRRRHLSVRLYDDQQLPSEARELVDVLEDLPHQQRVALTLRYWYGFNTSEIAETMSCRPGTVKSLISRGLSRLRIALGDEDR